MQEENTTANNKLNKVFLMQCFVLSGSYPLRKFLYVTDSIFSFQALCTDAKFGIAIAHHKTWGSRNLVGIAIQLSDSEEEKLFVHDSMQVSPE